MPIMLSTVLESSGLNLKDVRFVRHKDQRASKGRSPFELWRDQRPLFEDYQSSQAIKNRKKFSASHWCVFVVDGFDETMFAGIYSAKFLGLLPEDRPKPHIEGEIAKKGESDIYELTLDDRLSDLIGRMFIDWGAGALAWVQYADRQKNDKPIVEIRPNRVEAPFPGFLNFIEPLSRLPKLPLNWIEILKSSKGVYLLTCPKTKEQYVGSATGQDGFWGRWMTYFGTGHGNNKGLKNREPSDYQISILEVAGSSSNQDDVQRMEGCWQLKLQSREMGLNRNLAHKK
jgi:hypothetical protein